MGRRNIYDERSKEVAKRGFSAFFCFKFITQLLKISDLRKKSTFVLWPDQYFPKVVERLKKTNVDYK